MFRILQTTLVVLQIVFTILNIIKICKRLPLFLQGVYHTDNALSSHRTKPPLTLGQKQQKR